MAGSVIEISLTGLALALIPSVVVISIMAVWRASPGTALYATVRMLAQLVLIGYVLIYVFKSDNWLIVAAVISVMLTVAAWISIRTIKPRTPVSYSRALIAIAAGGLSALALVTQLIIDVEPWFSPRYVVPLAGMSIMGAMNAVSLAAERLRAEMARDVAYDEARRIAFRASMIPITNSLFAVGLVSLPGMMTGQILSGVSPLIAAQYQIVVMTMFFGATGIASATFLTLSKN